MHAKARCMVKALAGGNSNQFSKDGTDSNQQRRGQRVSGSRHSRRQPHRAARQRRHERHSADSPRWLRKDAAQQFAPHRGATQSAFPRGCFGLQRTTKESNHENTASVTRGHAHAANHAKRLGLGHAICPSLQRLQKRPHPGTGPSSLNTSVSTGAIAHCLPTMRSTRP